MIGTPGVVADSHRRVGIAVILELVERGLSAGLQQRAIERLPGLERQFALERVAMFFGQRFEPAERDTLDADGLALRDVDRDADCRLRVVQLGVERLSRARLDTRDLCRTPRCV